MVLTMIARHTSAIIIRKFGGKNKVYYLQALEASSEVSGRERGRVQGMRVFEGGY